MENALMFEVDDTSPTITFSPFRDTLSTPNLSAGWNPYYDESAFAAAQGIVGNGTSFHITSHNGAFLSIQWRGTGIQLIGNATSASYSITIDGQSATPQPDVDRNILTSIDGLEDTSHTVTLFAQIPPESTSGTSSMIVFDKFILTSSPSSSNVTFEPEVIADSEISFIGNWSTDMSSANNPSNFRISTTSGDRVTATFNGSSLLIQGKTSPTTADYQVILDNGQPTAYSSRSSFTTLNTTLYFATGLDPSVTHTVEVRNMDGGELALLMGGFSTFMSVETVDPTPSQDLPDNNVGATTTMNFTKGTMAAFILGGILAFVILSCILFYFIIYRPRRRRCQTYGSKSNFCYNSKQHAPVTNIAPDNNAPGSGGSGFSRWRREAVEGSYRGVSLPLAFGKPRSVDEKDVSDHGSYGGYDEAAVNSPVDDYSSARRKARAKSKGKARQITGRSWSPSFKLDLPLRRSQQQPKLQDAPASSYRFSSRPLSDGYVSTFMAVEGSPSEHAAAPPSYAASTSPHTSNSFASSIPSSDVQATRLSTHASYTQNPRYTTQWELPPTPDHESNEMVHHNLGNQAPPPSPATHYRDESLLGPSALREVIWSLSPRTSVRPASGYQSADADRLPSLSEYGINTASPSFQRSVLPDVQSISLDDPSRPSEQPTNARNSQARTSLAQTTKTEEDQPEHDSSQVVHVEEGLFLSVTETSPFRVDFDLRSLYSKGSKKKKTAADVASLKKNHSKKQARISSALSHVRFETMSGRSKSSASSKRKSMPSRTTEFVQGTSKAPFRLTPLTIASSKAYPSNTSAQSTSDRVTSFLDFSSSYEGSILSRSRSVQTTTSEEFGKWEEPVPPLPTQEQKSRWSSTTMPSDGTGGVVKKKSSGEPKSRWSNTTVPSLGTNGHGLQGSSSDSRRSPSSGEVEMGAETEGAFSTDSSTFPIPFKISIPPSPHHVMQPESSREGPSGSNSRHNRSRRSQPDSARALTMASRTTGSSHRSDLHVHPSMAGLESPTESMGPMSVSEIHFHHTESEGVASRRTTSSSMPQFINGDELPTLPEEYRPRPFDPSILVNRVLGLPSPAVSSTMSTARGPASHRTGDTASALAASSLATRTPSPRMQSRFS